MIVKRKRDEEVFKICLDLQMNFMLYTTVLTLKRILETYTPL